MSSVPAPLKKVLTKHCPFETTSMRMIQRVCALYLGSQGTITREALFELCEAAGLDELKNFRPNFTMNMKKDEAFFKLDKHPASWTLTSEGKAEAKRVFDNSEAPSTQPSRAGKPKAAKKAKTSKKKASSKKSTKKASAKGKGSKKKTSKKSGGKKKAASKKKTSKKKAAAKPKAKKKASTKKKKTSAAAKARLKKKRDLSKKADKPAAEPAPAAAADANNW